MHATALIIFAIAALGGLYLAAHVLRDRSAPWAVSIIHALLGATGLVLLIVLSVTGGGNTIVITSLVLFLIAALGGFFLASFHLRKKLPPKAMVVLHGVLAVVAFLILLVPLF